MSRFVRASKYRHVFGQPAKKEYGVDNVKVSASAWDTNLIAASGKYISVNWNASGGGAFAILPLPSPFAANPSFPSRLPDIVPLARSHTAPVLDTDWSPHDDSVVVSGGEDGTVCVWKVEPGWFDGWGAEGWEPKDFDPVVRIDASPRKIGQVAWHPTAQHVLASASAEHTIKLWDLNAPEKAQITLNGHNDAIQSLAWDPTGQLIATTCRDRKLRLFDPRASTDAIRAVDSHGGMKGARVIWMGDRGRLATTGFSKMSERQLGIWDAGSLDNIKTIGLDQSSGVLMPFWSDNGILFIAGKGDGNVRYYEHENDTLHGLDEHKSSEPQRGMCFLPRRALSVSDCEIARAYKIAGSYIEPIAFIVPRKSESFQSDIFPPAPSAEPSLSAGEYFSGKPVQLKLVSLDTGAISTSSAAAPTVSTPTPARTNTAPPPQPAVAPAPASAPAPAPAAAPTPATAAVPDSPPPVASPVERAAPPSRQASLATEPSAQNTNSGGSRALEEENAQLKAELREAREKLRNLELQVESMKANMRKATEALLN